MGSLFTRSRNERGSILALSAGGMVVALISVGLAVDLGGVAQEARRNQKVADLAALDAARVLPVDYQTAADASAVRNLFPTEPGHTVRAAEGVKVDGECVDQPGAGSVCVTVTSPYRSRFPFTTSPDSISRSAMAGAGNAVGTVRVGSTLASASGSIPPVELLLLNRTLGAMTGGSYSINSVGWRGLADSSVTFGELTTALGTLTSNADFTVGTPQEALDATFTMGQLLTAMANVLNNNGNSTVATNVTGIKNGINTTSTYMSQTLKLYDFFDFGSVELGNRQDVANAELNVLDMIRGGAILADGDHFATFDLTKAELPVPGAFNGATVSLGLIEAPRMSWGPPGKNASGVYYTGAHTSQIRVKIDLKVKVLLSNPITQSVLSLLTGLPVLNTLLAAGSPVDATFSYYLDAGTAHAYLDDIRCGTTAEPTGVDILGVTDVGTSKLGLVANTDLALESTIPVPANQTIVSGLLSGLINVKTTATTTTNIPGNPGELKTFLPPYDGATSQQVTGTELSVPSIATTQLTVDPLVLGLNTGSLFSDLVSGLNSTGLTFNSSAPGLSTSLIQPLYHALGLSFATADVWAPPTQTCAALSPIPVQSTATPVLKG